MARTRKNTRNRTLSPLRLLNIRLTKPRLIGIAAAVLLLALVTAYAWAGFNTVAGYQKRLTSGSFSYAGLLTFQGQDFLSPMNTNMNFSGAYTGDANPAVSTTFLGTWASHEYSGAARLVNNRLYFNLSGETMPTIRYRQGSYLLPLQPNQWYSARTDESLYDNICAHNQPSSLQGKLDLYRTVKSLKITPSLWINFWTRLQDFNATHVSGTVSGTQLSALWDAVQKASPPGCSDPNTLGLTSDDLKHVTTHVDLTSAHNGSIDALDITLTDPTLGATAKLNLLTSDYGQIPVVQAPVQATDLNALYSQLGLH